MERRGRPRRRALPRRRRARACATSRRAARSRRRGSARSTRKGTLTLARLGREAPIAMANPAGPVLREHGVRQRRRRVPCTPGSEPARSPVIGTDAPVQYERARTSGSRAGGSGRPWEGRDVQTPAPFGYERATSVEDAIAALQRLGSEARIIAGGHSLLPMMKLRLANPEHLVDINDLSELSFIREQDGEIRIGALTRHVALLKSDLLARALPGLPRRRDGDRRSGRAQPRHDRRLALPGRRGRGPLGRLRGAQGQGRDPRRTRRARGRHGGLPRRSLHDRGRRRRDADRDPAARAAGRRQRAREGRAPRRRLGDRRRVRRGLDRRRHDHRRRHRAQRRRADHHPPDPRRGAAARQGAVGGAVRAGGRDRRPRTARRWPTAAGRSTTSATSPACSPTEHCAGRRRARCTKEA